MPASASASASVINIFQTRQSPKQQRLLHEILRAQNVTAEDWLGNVDLLEEDKELHAFATSIAAPDDNGMLTLYCQRSGAPYAKLTPQAITCYVQLANEAETHGEANMLSLHEVTSLMPGNAPHWQSLTPERLEALSRLDPIGYFVFMASRICRTERSVRNRDSLPIGFNPRTPGEKQATNLEEYKSLLCSKALLWRALQQEDLELIKLACSILSKFDATIGFRSFMIPVIWPHQLGRPEILRKVLKLLQTWLAEKEQDEHGFKARYEYEPDVLQYSTNMVAIKRRKLPEDPDLLSQALSLQMRQLFGNKFKMRAAFDDDASEDTLYEDLKAYVESRKPKPAKKLTLPSFKETSQRVKDAQATLELYPEYAAEQAKTEEKPKKMTSLAAILGRK